MTDTKHSPLPWRIDEIRHPASPTRDVWIVDKSDGVVLLLDKDKAQFIITACNSHYENLETIAVLKEALEEYMSQIGQGYADNGLPFTKYQEEADKIARNALAKVKP